MTQRLIPRQPVPALSISTVDGDDWVLSERSPQHFTMLVFYRGLHCPVCRRYLTELNGMADKFAERGVDVFCLSTDTEERARQARHSWGLEQLVVGYGLTIEAAREWGLYISAGRGKTSVGIEEPALFSEPGMFFVRPDGSLYWSNIGTMPFARPRFDDLLAAVDTVLKINYPARGES